MFHILIYLYCIGAKAPEPKKQLKKGEQDTSPIGILQDEIKNTDGKIQTLGNNLKVMNDKLTKLVEYIEKFKSMRNIKFCYYVYILMILMLIVNSQQKARFGNRSN